LRFELAQVQLAEPMRVAIVGAIKAGKSTLMNALLGKAIVPTARLVLTYNVNRFYYTEGEAYLAVRFKDDTYQRRPFSELEAFVTQCEASKAFQDNIWYVDVFYPHPLLKQFQLIDTPGLESCIESDSSRTRELLVAQESRPHAVVFLFEKSFSARIMEEVDRFHDACGSLMSGITAIACLSKADCLTRGFADAEAVICQDTHMFPRLRRAFYTIMPIAAQLDLAGQLLGDDDLVGLRALAALPAELYEDVLADAESFYRQPYEGEPAVPHVEARARLYARLGWPVVPFACGVLRAEPRTTRDELARWLREGSGLGRLLQTLERHFGQRAALIKLKATLDGIRQEGHELQYRVSPPGRVALGDALARLDEFVSREQMFREYGVLEDYYNGRVMLTDGQIRDLLNVTGEHGDSPHERLAVPPGATTGALLAAAERKHRYWRVLANDITKSQVVQDVARVISDSYAGLMARLHSNDGLPRREP